VIVITEIRMCRLQAEIKRKKGSAGHTFSDTRGRYEDRLLSCSPYSSSLCLPLGMVKTHQALG